MLHVHRHVPQARLGRLVVRPLWWGRPRLYTLAIRIILGQLHRSRHGLQLRGYIHASSPLGRLLEVVLRPSQELLLHHLRLDRLKHYVIGVLLHHLLLDYLHPRYLDDAGDAAWLGPAIVPRLAALERGLVGHALLLGRPVRCHHGLQLQLFSILPIHQGLHHGATSMINLLILCSGTEKGLLVEVHGHQATTIRVGRQVELP